VARLGLLALSALAAAAAAAAVAAPGRTTTSAAPSPCGRVLPPARGSYLGAFTDFNTRKTYTEDHVSGGLVAAFEQLADHQLSWVYFSQPWYRGLRFPRERVLTIWRHGAVPYIAFLPSSGVFYGPGPKQHNPEHRFTLQRIVDGVFDRQLRAWADGARTLDVPVLLSFGSEVNDEQRPWNARWNGADRADGYGDPSYPDGAERYRDAYRHLVKLFRAEGARNVSFVFHVDSSPPVHGWNAPRLYYPGDGYVDWLGISVYGTLDPRLAMSPFARKLDVSGVYRTLTRLSPRPIAVAGMGTVERAAGEKAAWIRSAFRALRSGRYPRVRAAVWWSMDSGVNTRIDSSPRALQAFRAGVTGRYFSAPPLFAGDCRPPPPAVVVATSVSPGVIRVRWSPVTVASSYDVWRDGHRIGTTKATTWVDRTARPGPPHTYRVRAVDPGGTSV
jgi:hypothetical protein